MYIGELFQGLTKNMFNDPNTPIIHHLGSSNRSIAFKVHVV